MAISCSMKIPLKPKNLPEHGAAKYLLYLLLLVTVFVGGLRINVIFAALQA